MASEIDRYSPAVVSYARALLELASEQNQAEPLNVDLQAFREAIQSDPAFNAFLRDPAIGAE